ncbi:MAG: hypothetical protein MJA30_12650 [Cytophagales bacterium]|nr:hypothetical protein [Cytophagales bacterium]
MLRKLTFNLLLMTALLSCRKSTEDPIAHEATQAQLRAFQSWLTALEKRVECLQTTLLIAIDGRFEGLQTRLTNLGELPTQLEAIQRELTALGGLSEELQTRQTNLGELPAQIEATQSELNALGRLPAQMEATQSELRALGGLTAQMEAIQSELRALGGLPQLEAIQSQVTALGSQFEELQTSQRNLGELPTKMDSLQGKVTALGDQLGELSTNMASIQSQVAALGSRLEGLQTRQTNLDELPAQLEAIQSQVAALGSEEITFLGDRGLAAFENRAESLGVYSLHSTSPSSPSAISDDESQGDAANVDTYVSLGTFNDRRGDRNETADPLSYPIAGLRAYLSSGDELQEGAASANTDGSETADPPSPPQEENG